MAWFNNNKITNAIKLQVNSLQSQTLLLRDRLAGVLGESHGGKRSTYDIYGYPQEYQFIDGYNAIKREGIASRIVRGVSASCWRNGFEVTVLNKDNKADVVLEDEIASLNMKQMFSKIERADTLNRIGKFSCLFVGVPDNKEASEPLGKVTGNAIESLYFRVFAYDGIEITEYENDIKNPRYGLPIMYQLSYQGRGDTEKTTATESINVHYSRVVHMAESLLDSDIEGIPALAPVYNRILDIDKTTGGAAEAYFRNARGKIAFEIDPEFSSQLINDKEAQEKFDDAGKKFTNNWQDQIAAVGSKVQSITTPHQSPLDTLKVIMWEISGYTGIPIRVLTGEGGGQLAGSEDRLAYNALIQDRQDQTCTNWVRNILEILDFSGVIRLPEKYDINFPLDEPLNLYDQAELANKKADTMLKLTQASSNMAGDSIDLESAMSELGLGDIDIDELGDLEPVDDMGGEMDPKPLDNQ